MNFKTQHKPLSAFNFSSLTDIVILLLIFFLLTSQFVVQTGVKVKLPGAKNNEQTSATNLTITLTDKGKIYLNTEEVTFLNLSAKLAQVPQSLQNNLVIRADQSVKIDAVIKVIDIAKGIGVDKFTIQTEKESF
jgi:biopolymer transport protein ExbD